MRKTNSGHTYFSIGNLAKASCVGIETIRFYEKKGLLERPSRTASGYRQYSFMAVKQLAFIQRAKDLGFSLKEIKELIDLRIEAKGNCKVVRSKAEEKLSQVRAKINSLRKIEVSLKKLMKACDSRKITDQCPILAELETVDTAPGNK